MASPTVVIFSASSSGMEIPNSFSNSMISSTVSRESAPRSLAKLYVSSISFSATFNLSFIISTTFDEISDITFNFSSTIFCK